MTANQRFWAAVLKRLAVDFPRSPYAELEDPIETARIWALSLAVVPAEAILPLYERLSMNWTNTFEPNVADFRRIWLEWDYWAQINHDPEADAPAVSIAALMEGARNLPLASSLWHRIGQGREVVCHCRFDDEPFVGARNRRFIDGVYRAAQLTEDGRWWECARRKCSFRVAAGDESAMKDFFKVVSKAAESDAETSESGGGQNLTAAQKWGVERPETAEAPAIDARSDAEKLAAAYNLDYSRCDERQVIRLRQLAAWLGGDFGDAKKMFATFGELQSAWSQTRKKPVVAA